MNVIVVVNIINEADQGGEGRSPDSWTCWHERIGTEWDSFATGRSTVRRWVSRPSPVLLGKGAGHLRRLVLTSAEVCCS
jgi:hypothetical protein